MRSEIPYLQQPVYLLSSAAVSPQASFEQMLSSPTNYIGNQLSCIEPDYAKYIDAKQLRRMSRIVKMGVAAAFEALKQSNTALPDAIITGTAYGCLADTEQFLTRMVASQETVLSPTAFIRSTHNTVAAQIALALQCHHYNNTYVHRGLSFESALIDALSLFEENEAKTILLGAADETTEHSHAILKRFGLYKQHGESLNMIGSTTKGTMAGEGAAFFVLSCNKTANVMAQIQSVASYYKPRADGAALIQSFLTSNQLHPQDIDFVLMGNNGDLSADKHYSQIKERLFTNNFLSTYKQYCGEYPTSSAFALWMGAHILQQKGLEQKNVDRLLIYNNYLQRYPSLYLLSAC